MAERFDWQGTNDRSDLVHRAAEVLVRGGLVAVPTETVYGVAASAISSQAVERLVSCKGRPEDKPLTLAIRSPAQAEDWVYPMSRLGRRLSRRCWPGPVTLVFADGIDAGLGSRLPEAVWRRVRSDQGLGLRVAAHDAVDHLLRLIPFPLVLTSANRSGEPPATTGQAVVEAIGDRIDCIIDDGPCRYGQASTVVAVQGSEWRVLREGVVASATLRRLAACLILFVCTGNTCRSPLAEAICRKLLAEKLGCRVDQLSDRGYEVQSAGISAFLGGRASPDAVAVGRELGVDLEPHISQPLTPQLLQLADMVFTMGRSHLAAIKSRFPWANGEMQLLSPEGKEIADPIGGGREVYRQCADQITEALKQRLEHLPQ